MFTPKVALMLNVFGTENVPFYFFNVSWFTSALELVNILYIIHSNSNIDNLSSVEIATL